jgi:hypothetical protein
MTLDCFLKDSGRLRDGPWSKSSAGPAFSVRYREPGQKNGETLGPRGIVEEALAAALQVPTLTPDRQPPKRRVRISSTALVAVAALLLGAVGIWAFSRRAQIEEAGSRIAHIPKATIGGIPQIEGPAAEVAGQGLSKQTLSESEMAASIPLDPFVQALVPAKPDSSDASGVMVVPATSPTAAARFVAAAFENLVFGGDCPACPQIEPRGNKVVSVNEFLDALSPDARAFLVKVGSDAGPIRKTDLDSFARIRSFEVQIPKDGETVIFLVAGGITVGELFDALADASPLARKLRKDDLPVEDGYRGYDGSTYFGRKHFRWATESSVGAVEPLEEVVSVRFGPRPLQGN